MEKDKEGISPKQVVEGLRNMQFRSLAKISQADLPAHMF